MKGVAIAGLAAGIGGAGQAEAPEGPGRTFILVHGAWHGGWCWIRVANRLRALGHAVYTPTQTGLAERKHLLSKDITLDTFTKDIANLIEAEELSDAVLVGHSFGGLAISAVADLMPDRIRRLVYLDSLIVEGGKSPIGAFSPEIAEARKKLAEETSGGVSLPPPAPSTFGVSDPQDAEWLKRRMTPHPFGTYLSPLNIRGPVGNGLPKTYLACTSPIYAALEGVRQWVKAQQGWIWREIATGHDAMVIAPEELTRLLLAEAA